MYKMYIKKKQKGFYENIYGYPEDIKKIIFQY